MVRLEDLEPKRFKMVEDVFKIRCFHLAYRCLGYEYRNRITEKFVIAIATTSDIKLDLKNDEVYKGFEEWYYNYFVYDRRGGKRGPRKKLVGRRKEKQNEVHSINSNDGSSDVVNSVPGRAELARTNRNTVRGGP